MTIHEARADGFSAMLSRLDIQMHRACRHRGMETMEDVIIEGFESVNGESPIDDTMDYHERSRDFVNFVDGVVWLTNHVLNGGTDA